MRYVSALPRAVANPVAPAAPTPRQSDSSRLARALAGPALSPGRPIGQGQGRGCSGRTGPNRGLDRLPVWPAEDGRPDRRLRPAGSVAPVEGNGDDPGFSPACLHAFRAKLFSTIRPLRRRIAGQAQPPSRRNLFCTGSVLARHRLLKGQTPLRLHAIFPL